MKRTILTAMNIGNSTVMKKIFTSIVAVCFAAALWAQGGVIRLYCQMNHSWWTDSDAAVGAYLYGGEGVNNAEWPGVRMTAMENGIWYIDADTTVYHYVIFTRVNGSDEVVDWGAKTADLAIPSDGKNLYTITSSSAVWGDPGVEGYWSVYDGTNVPTQQFYLIGNTEQLGAWSLENALPMESGAITLNLPAGTYSFKVLPQNDGWDGALGYNNFNSGCSSENVTTDVDGNVVVTFSEAGELNVSVVDGLLCVTGTFSYTSEFVNFTVDVTPEGAGYVYPTSGSYQRGSTLSLEASISTGGWMFDQWSDNGAWDNPRSLYLTQDTTVTAIFSPGEYGILINGNRLVRGTFTERLNGSYIAQFRASASLSAGDQIKIINLFHGDNSSWRPELEEGGSSESFSVGDAELICNQAGCYDIYMKIAYGQSSDYVYIGGGTDCSTGEPFGTGDIYVYSVVGTANLFGTAWDKVDTKTEMTLQGESMYAYTLDSVALWPDSVYEYKVISNHEWNVQEWPNFEENYNLSVEEPGVYQVLFMLNPETGCTATTNYLHAIQDEQPCGIIASGECGADGANVTWLLTCDSILTIGGDGRMADYNEETTIAPWYEYRDAYHSVYIAAGVLNAGDLAFRESPNLRYVDLASTVVSLGNYSFYNCPNLHSLTLPESVTTLSDNTPFGGTTTMTNPVLNSSVFVRLPEEYAGEYTVAEGTTVIASQAFKGCNQLTSLVLPNTVHILSGSSIFENCTMLVSVNIPEGVTALGEFTFSNCSSLKAIDLPSTLASLGSYCFGDCWMIESITCRATTPPEANGSSLSGVNYMIPIYVPAGTAEIYKAADGWSGFTDYRDIENGGSSPTEAAPTPTYLVTQVKAIYSPTYDADCDFGEWGSGTTYTQDTYGKKFVTTDLGYFGLGFPSLNCTNMEYLHFDIWITANSSVRVVPIWGGEEQGITKNLTANKWNSVDIPLSEFDAVTDWYNVYQVKIDNAANMTLWVGNAYFYTKQAVMEDNEAPTNVTGTFSLASCFSTTLILSATDNSGSVMFSVRSEGKEVATIAGASSTPLNVTITNLRPSTMYTFSIVVKDEVGNEAAPITVTATTLSAPASAPAPDIIGKHVVPVFCDAIENTPTINIGGWGQTTTAMYGELTDGDHAYCCINFNYLGLEISPAVDASDMDYLHVDIYTTDMQYISVTPISPTHEGTKTVQLTANKWTPIDISINDYADASIDWSNIYQFKFFDANPTGTTLIFDNIYFYHSDGDEDSTIKHGITWIANSVILQIDSISEGNNITSLPDTPSSCSTGQVFAGWTDAPIDNVQSEAPAPLYTSVADIPAITEDMTLYAVYATDSASYIFDAVRQEGWTNTANLTSGSYWLLNSESELVSPEIDLTRLKTITMTIRSYGGTSNNTVNVYANNQQIATIIAPDKTLKEVTWTNDQLLSGSASIHFKTNYSGSAGVGFSSVTIEIDSDRKYSTTCDTPYCVLEDGTCGVDGSNIMWSLSCDSVLTISGQGVMKDYSNSPWGDKKEAIKTVRFEGEITNIGKYAFYYCRNLTNIIIPESITNIGDYAFAGCTGLTSIDIPESVTSIGKAAFYYCQGLMFFTIPSGVTRIESSTFAECFALTSISIPSGITSIGSGAFQGCNYLDSIIIPDGVTSIENNVFYDCFSLTSIIIPERVTSIGEKAFFDCVGLTSISIPNGVTSIGDDAFWGCYSLVSATISNRVTSIGNNVFYGCKGLPSIIIPDSVKSIGDSAFEGCTGLTSIIIPDGLISIGTKAFFSCNGLTSIVIPEGVQSIGDNAFFGCSKLSKISIPRKMTSIGNSVFGNCSGLTSITIPDNITSIGQSAFSGCSGLTSIIIPSSVKSIGSVAFSNCSRLDTISLPNSVTSIGSYAFNECVNLTSITIPDSVTSIENNVFSYCNKLSSITIPNGVRSIGKEAFHYCVKLAVINLPSSITSIGEMAFYGCRALTSINIPDGVTSIEKSVFSSCSGLTSVTIPKNVTSIVDGAFENCSKITSISIPNSVTSIGGSAFANDSTLLSITIPEKVTSIGIYTFSNCINLASITCKSPNPPIVEAYAFENVNKSILVYVPAESVGLYSESSGWREFSNIKAMNGGEPITSYSVVGDSVLIGMNWNVESMQTEMTRGADGVSWTYVIDSVALKANIQYKFKIIANHTWSVAQYPSENEDYILTVPKDDDYTVTFTFVLGKGGTATAVHYPQRILVEDFTPQDGSTTTYVTTPTTKICSQAEWTFYLGGVLENIGKFDSYAAIVRAKKSSETEYGYILSSPISGGINDLWFTWNSNGTEEGQNWDVKIYVNDILAGSITEPGTAQLTEKPFNTFKVSNLKVAGDFTIKIVNESPYTGTSNKLRLVIDDLSWTAYDGYSGESQGDCDSFTGECGAQGNNLTWSLNCDSVLTISGTGAMENYSFNSDGQAPWAEYGLDIRDIVIEEGVSSIGSYAFYNAGSYTNGAYNNVRSVTIPSTVTKLQNNYFYQCPVQTVTINSDSIVGQTSYSSNSSLHKMFGAQVRQYIIGDSVKSIANSAFYNQSADSLKSILLPEGLTSIGSWAFGYLENLDSITLPSGLQSIGSDAFYGSGLRAVTIPGSVTDMGGQAFQNCDKLASVILEEGLKTLGTSAFQNCTALTEITIPESMVTISSGAFTDCTHLTKMTVLATAWVGADKSSSSTTKLAIGNYVRELILGDQIPTIGKYAFSSLDSLRTVTLPFNVTSISNYAFSSCPSLTCVISNALTPPTIQSTTFSTQDTLIVPCESKQLYKTAQYWQNFNRIRCADDQEMSISLTGNWTFIMVPSTFGMDAGDVTTEGEVQWGTYNGSTRAMGRSGWENYSAEAVHMCSQALIVRATGETATLHINVPTNATAMAGTTVSLIPNAAALPQNANWCFTGNPYPYGYLLSGLAAQGITSPIAVWNGTGYDTYTPGIDDYIIPAFGAFFIQLPEGTVEPTVINFSAEYIYM